MSFAPIDLTKGKIQATQANGVTLFSMSCAKCKQRKSARGSKIKLNQRGQRYRICASCHQSTQPIKPTCSQNQT